MACASISGCGDDAVGTTPDAGPVPAAVCTSSAECGDGVFCNGAELCAPGSLDADESGCVAATAAPCGDHERCDEGAEACLPPCDEDADADDDGHDAVDCGGDDCDDADADRYPGNPEVCDADGRDEDCNPETLGPDEDGDGYVGSECCNEVEGELRCGLDCDDERPSISPEAIDDCNGIDDNCDGVPDDMPDRTYFEDADGDGYGVNDTTIAACAPPAGFSLQGGDCDDGNRNVNPSVGTDRCDGESDDDCDGAVDEGCPCTIGATQICGPDEEVGICRTGMQRCEAGFWSSCVGSVEPAPGGEVCNGLDDDCNGILDGPDADTDDDGVRNCVDTCPGDPNQTTLGPCLCGEPADDTDGDGVPRCLDECPDDPEKSQAGVCGCGRAERNTLDTDGDGVADCVGFFGEQSIYDLPGTRASRFNVSDLDQDGLPDILVTSADGAGPGYLSIYFGRSSGGFDAPTVLRTNPSPMRMEVADLNGDGLLDLAMGSDDHEISIWLATAPRVLEPAAAVPLQGWLHDLVVDDFDGDGVLDIAVAEIWAAGIEVALGNGDGTFGTPMFQSTGTASIYMKGADVNADGVTDLLVTRHTAGVVDVFHGTGVGTFALAQTIEVPGASSGQVILRDHDGDGAIDLLSNTITGEVLVWPGSSGGTFGAPERVARSTGYYLFEDINSDGIDDFISLAYASGAVTVQIGLPGAALGPPEAQAHLTEETWRLDLADLNLDGRRDAIAITLGAGPPRLVIRSGQGEGALLRDPVLQPVRSGPYELEQADFDGDGTMDLAVTHAIDEVVAILEGTGEGAFVERAAIPAGADPRLEVADLNGDGVPDIAVVSRIDQLLTVCLGDAAWGYTCDTADTFERPGYVSVGDVSGDGVVDLVISYYFGNAIEIREGAGDGTFAPPVSVSRPIPFIVEVADIDGDGVAEILSASNGLAVIERAGDTYVARQIDGEVEASQARVVDFDEDGALDLVMVHYLGGGRYVAGISYGDGAGGFESLRTWPTGARAGRKMAVADVNADGNLDLVNVDPLKRRFELHLGDGSGGLLAPSLWASGRGPQSAVVFDADEDGFLDVVVANSTAGQLSVHTGAPARAPRPNLQRAPAGLGPRALDWPVHAGSIGALVALVGESELAASPILSEEVVNVPGVGRQPTAMTSADLDGDGTDEVLVTNELDGTVVVLRWSDSSSAWTDAGATELGRELQDIAAADFDGDGAVDIVVAAEGSDEVVLALGTGAGAFGSPLRYPVPGARAVTAGDVDRDGHIDVLAIGRDGRVHTLPGDGTGALSSGSAVEVAGGPSAFVLVDLDGDGSDDLVVACEDTDQLAILTGAGDGSFTEERRLPTGRRPQAVTIADLHGDGGRDIVVADEASNTVTVYREESPGDYGRPRSFFVGTAPQDVLVRDIDGDGQPEIITANEGSNDLGVLHWIW